MKPSGRRETRGPRPRPRPPRVVLVVCGPGDEHALAVALHLAELGVRAVPADLARLPERGL